MVNTILGQNIGDKVDKINMGQDNIISFTGGYILTAGVSTLSMAVYQAALVGLVGGIFGMMGKELYLWLKSKIIKK
tara:strand:- start:4231 stop:4458 length:228 start_codon:yes stop_codon:yes gene_type:complete